MRSGTFRNLIVALTLLLTATTSADAALCCGDRNDLSVSVGKHRFGAEDWQLPDSMTWYTTVYFGPFGQWRLSGTGQQAEAITSTAVTITVSLGATLGVSATMLIVWVVARRRNRHREVVLA